MNNSFYELLATGIFGYANPRVAANDVAAHRPDPLPAIASAVRAVARWTRTWLIMPFIVSQKRVGLYKALEAKSDRQLAKGGIARTDLVAIAFNAFGDNGEARVTVAAVGTAVTTPAANDQPVQDGTIAA